MKCKHCDECEASAPRGLCGKCYSRPNIRKLYPAERGGHLENGQTLEDLERQIAERLPTMPTDHGPKEGLGPRTPGIRVWKRARN